MFIDKAISLSSLGTTPNKTAEDHFEKRPQTIKADESPGA